MSTTILANPLPKLTTLTGSVSGGIAGSGNFYSFSVSSDSIFNFVTDPIFVSGVSKGDSDLILYRIVNGETLFNAGSTGSTGESDSINTVLSPGDYQLAVIPFIGNVNYTLTINQALQVNTDFSGFGINNSYNLGPIDWGLVDEVVDIPDHKLVSDAGTIIDFLGHKGDLHDGYSFRIDKPTTVTFTLTPDANSNIDLALYDEKDSQIKGSFNDSGVADTVTAELKAGTYWIDASFVSSNNPKDPGTGAFTANYDLSISTNQYVLPTTSFRPFNGSAVSLANTFNFNNSQQPETISITNAVYSGKVEQSAVVNNFAGEVNAGVLLTTGNASSILGHTYNQKQGQSTSNTETAKNWSNTNGNQNGMQPLTSAGATAGYNADVFNEVSKLVTGQNAVLDDAHKLAPITGVGDAASLSFDVTVSGQGNYLSFDLMFASEEFALFANKYVDSAVIMVDGKNYALFDQADPTSLLSVTQANVDNGYFYPNTQLADGTSIYPTEFNGVSRLISVLAPIDTTLTTHHISIAIADTNDHVLDSGFFLTNLDSLDLRRPAAPPDEVSTAVGRDGLYSNEAGTAADDVMAGTENRDLSILGGGNDQIESGGGNDVVDGGSGNDAIDAGTGDDLLLGGIGNDSVNGGLGADEISGGAGKDTIAGGEGDDVIEGGLATDKASDKLDGGTGDDFITGAGGVDTITGGTGSDSVDGGAGNDKITGGTDAIGDNLDGGVGNDTIIDGGGNDTVAGGAGNDSISSGGGADIITGDTGRDSINAGAGNDEIIGGTDTLGDNLNGGAGNDDIVAGAGSDTITGGTGIDSVDGGAGNDRITGGTDALGDNLDGGAGNDTVTAGAGADTITGGTGLDAIDGGAGNDEISGGTDTIGDDLDGGAGNDSITAGDGSDSITGGTGLDSIDGGAGNDDITGGTDDIGDNLDGGAGNDSVAGATGEDVIDGGEGNDVLEGGEGNDTISGGAGQDDFMLTTTTSVDTFMDFSVTDDTISIDISIFTSITSTVTVDNLATGDAATDANDFLVYNSSTGGLFYDADGNGPGEAVEVAVIGANLGLTSSDFSVI